ncbi:MAG: extracellular solute-binding protein, partial [Christensenellales bacterium]
MRKKTVYFLCLILCLSAVFTGCGTQEDLLNEVSIESIQAKYDSSMYSYDGDAVTIRLATWDSAGNAITRQVMDVFLEAFNNRYPNITVEYEVMSNYETNYAGNIATGNLHDVFLVSDGVFGNWVTGGMMENLEPYINSSELVNRSEMYESLTERYSYNSATGKTGSGDQYTIASDISSFVMFYNKDYFDSMGVAYPPSDRVMTIDEATEMWQALTKRDENGDIVVYGTSALDICGLVWSGGGDFLNDEKTAFPTDEADLEALAQAFQYVQDSYYKYKITPTVALDAATMFTMEKVACCVAGSWNTATFRSLDFNWDIAYIPAYEENPGANCWSGSAGYSIYSGSKNKEAAWKFVEYVGSKEGQEILMSTGTQLSTYSLLESDIVRQQKELGPANYEILMEAASTQPAGRWTYLKNQQWIQLGYDLYSGNLLDANEIDMWT